MVHLEDVIVSLLLNLALVMTDVPYKAQRSAVPTTNTIERERGGGEVAMATHQQPAENGPQSILQQQSPSSQQRDR